MEVSTFTYQKFVQFALEETQLHTNLAPLPSQDKFKCMKAKDNKTQLHALSFRAPKIRLLRSLTIKETHKMQVLDFAVFPEPEFDLPIFCANFFTTSSINIIVLDLNPLHNIIDRKDYKEKYYKKLMPLGQKYAEIFPWGDKITAESLSFFSPIVVWTKFTSSQKMYENLYSAFVEYYKAWLELMDQVVEETDTMQILHNQEVQHKYLTWRAEKDPGHPLLKRLIGENLAKDFMRNFLFDGVNSLGAKTFLDYFPKYRSQDGTINPKRSIIGKSFETRPWDARGQFIGNNTGYLDSDSQAS